VDQEFVLIVSHHELVFLGIGVWLMEQFVGFEVRNQVADEFVVPDIDNVEKAEIVSVDESSPRIT
jgi:hypothetical protein